MPLSEEVSRTSRNVSGNNELREVSRGHSTYRTCAYGEGLNRAVQ